jgi:hypothetical protein
MSAGKMDAVARFLAAHERALRTARTPNGREALLGEWMAGHSVDRSIVAEVEAFCSTMNREWGRK